MYRFYPLRSLPAFDLDFNYNRLYTLIQALQNGTFPFYMDNNVLDGYGYFTKAFYPDSTLLPFAVIGYFTNLYIAYQALIFTMTFLCGFFTYIAVYKIYKNSFAAAIGSILFTFVQYRLSVMYYRGSLGEAMAFTFIPLVAWGVYEILKGDYKKWYILTIAYFFLVNTHLISGVTIFVIMLVFLIIYYQSFVKEPARLKSLFLSGITILITCSYFLFPMFEQLYSNSFWATERPALQFLRGRFPMGVVISGMFKLLNEERNIGVGGLLTVMVCIRFFIIGKKSLLLRSADYCVIISLFCTFMCSYFFPWNIFPFTLLHFIQFPWRFMHVSTFLLSMAGGFYISQLLAGHSAHKFLFLSFIILFSCYGMRFGQDEYFYPKTPVITATTMDFRKTVIGAEYLPIKVPSVKWIEERGDVVTSAHNTAKISQLERRKDGLSFALKTNQKDVLELPLIYYKGYRAELNGEELSVGESKNGLLEVTAAQSGKVTVYYAGTVVQKISVWITILSLLALIGYIVWPKRNS
jgi:hypothetical protein